jgi:hypothetical protein
MKKIDRRVILFLAVFFILLLIIDRYYWAQISQWREDQATNLWLGYTRGLTDIPVGLMSSYRIPNPNGMVLFASFLSYLPNLVSVSLFLGLSQIILLMLVAWNSSKQNWRYFLLVLIPSVASVILRSTSIEFWNQYLLTLINLLFLFCALKYLEKPSLWLVPPILALVCIAPSLYLAGIVNAVVMILLTIGIILYKRPARENMIPILTLSILIVFSSLALTWLPYFRNITLEQFARFSDREPSLRSITSMVEAAWESFFEFPIYTTFQWGTRSNFDEAFKHADARILSPSTNLMLKIIARLYLLQAIFAFTALIYGVVRGKTQTKEVKLRYDQSVAQIVVLSMLFIIVSYTVSIWLGGPAWNKDSRPDQIVQFLPMSLFVIFLLPFLIIINGRAGQMILKVSSFSLLLFGTFNLLCGFMIIRDQLNYRGREVTEADVPLRDKIQVVKFIANDWKNHSDSNIVPVDYRIGGGKWDNVSEFGLQLEPWYPAPFTQGRGFDYALKRQYGLTNYQEGTQLRTFGSGRYLITYVFEDAPQVPDGQITHYVFGRLRVSIVESNQ